MGDDEYRPFRDLAQRNLTQSLIEVPLMVRLLGLPSGRRLLEVGCGRGNALPAFTRILKPRRLLGIDIDQRFLVEASRNAESNLVPVDLVRADVRWMPFSNAAFDVVVDFGTCYHISRSELAVAEVQRVLSDGGVFGYETPANQLLSHPIRSFGRSLPWESAKSLRPQLRRLLWSTRVKAPERKRLD